MKLYGVVNIDIVGSRKVQDRDGLQKKIEENINKVNTKYATFLAAPISITLGDEWQLISHSPFECYNLLHEFQKLFWRDGIDLYAGIGIGEISTSLNQDIRKLDGPCFHMAREALNTIKKMLKPGNKNSVSKQNRVFIMLNGPQDSVPGDILDSFAELMNSDQIFTDNMFSSWISTLIPDSDETVTSAAIVQRTLNVIIENNEILKARMTDKQREVYIKYIELGSYRKVAALCEGETIGGISQKLNSAQYFTILRNQQMVSLLINLFCNRGA